jgi:hypothetical protein
MTRVWLATIRNKKVSMEDYVERSFHDWCYENEGKQVRITPQKKPVSIDMRNFYFGAVIPVVRSTCEEWKNLNSIEMHEIIKKMFFYFESYNPLTKRTERFGKSVMSDSEWNNTAKAMEFLMVIAEYLADCGLMMPNPEEYKEMRDSAPLIRNE